MAKNDRSGWSRERERARHANGFGLVLTATAADFAARVHAGQTRKGGTQGPFLDHLAEVAGLLAVATRGEDAELVAAGWLHDAAEKAGVEIDELRARFGDDVADLVAAVTDRPGLGEDARRAAQVDATAFIGERARLLRLADKISKLRSLAAAGGTAADATVADELRFAEAVAARCLGLNVVLDFAFAQAVVALHPERDAEAA